MSVSVYDFAAALPGLRPQLHSTLQHRYPCQPEDAEDLVEDAIADALEKLDQFKEEGRLYPQITQISTEGKSQEANLCPSVKSVEKIPASLLNWLKGFLVIRIMRARDRAARCPQTVPLDLVADLPEPPPTTSPREVLLAKIARLPAEQRPLVSDWLDGYNQTELAQMYRLHRNTVANRLSLAFETLGTDPDADRLTYSTSLFDKCRRQAIYRKPPGSCHRWMRRLPRDVSITLRGNTEDRSSGDRRVRYLRRAL